MTTPLFLLLILKTKSTPKAFWGDESLVQDLPKTPTKTPTNIGTKTVAKLPRQNRKGTRKNRKRPRRKRECARKKYSFSLHAKNPRPLAKKYRANSRACSSQEAWNLFALRKRQVCNKTTVRTVTLAHQFQQGQTMI